MHGNQRCILEVHGVACLLMQPHMCVVQGKACRLRQFEAEHGHGQAAERRLSGPCTYLPVTFAFVHFMWIVQTLVNVGVQRALALGTHMASIVPATNPIRRLQCVQALAHFCGLGRRHVARPLFKYSLALHAHHLLVQTGTEDEAEGGIERVIRRFQYEHAETQRDTRQVFGGLIVRIDRARCVATNELEKQLLRCLECNDRCLNKLVCMIAVGDAHMQALARDPDGFGRRRSFAVGEKHASSNHAFVP